MTDRSADRPEETGPAPGALATVDRLSRALAGGTGLRDPDAPGGRGSIEPPTPEVARRNLMRLLLVVAAVVAVCALLNALTTLLVITVLLACIMLHELGHLVMAKRAGMKVTEYFVGFGPRLWSVRRGETTYGIKPILAGGYVRIIGMNNLDPVAPEDEARSYRAKSFPRRLSVAVAGSAMHFIIALVLLFTAYALVGVDRYNAGPTRVAEVETLTTGPSPAQTAGFKAGDVILGADGHHFKGFDDLRVYIQHAPGKSVAFEVRRAGQSLTLVAVPADLRTAVVKDPAGVVDTSPRPASPQGFLGIVPAATRVRANPIAAVGLTGQKFGEFVMLTFRSLGSIASPHGLASYSHQVFNTGKPVKPADAGNRFSSPIGIVRVTNKAVKAGYEPLFAFLAVLNVFIGIFNLLPLLPFDGGLVAIAVYERIRSRKGQTYRADVRRLLPLTYGVVMVLLFIFVSAVYLDITKPL